MTYFSFRANIQHSKGGMRMDLINKIFDVRDDELVSISAKEKKELLTLCPNYYKPSNLETLITGNTELEKAFEEFSSDTSTINSYFNKKYYLAGLKDGFEIFNFLKK